MAIYQLTRQQTFPISLSQAWDFFSDPRNLAAITPAWLGFEILDDLPPRIHAGMLIRYRVRPMFGIPVTWVTEITQVQQPTMFIDEQLVGPYALWHHQHHFREISAGVESTDLVTFKLPAGVIGTLVYHITVKRKLHEIFDYRHRVLAERFGSLPSPSKQ